MVPIYDSFTDIFSYMHFAEALIYPCIGLNSFQT